MDSRSLDFVGVMIAIAAVAVGAFVVYLITRYARRPATATAGGQAVAPAPNWYEFLLALAALIVVGAILIWQFYPVAEARLAATDWRGDARSVVFLTVMAIAGILGLIGFLVFAIVRQPRRTQAAGVDADDTPTATATAGEAAAPPATATSSGARLLGLLLLAVAFLLLNWIYLPGPRQYALMLQLVYPASLAVALVLLFDKATRAWSVKTGGETVREWLFCDGLVFLLILGYLNLARAATAESYAALELDLLFIVLFFVVFWLLDRALTRYRFLLAHGFMILLPIMLLIWRLAQSVATPEGLSWWSTIWPFFFLALVFFVLEVIMLVATTGAARSGLGAAKDAVFLILYGILLIIAIPEAAA